MNAIISREPDGVSATDLTGTEQVPQSTPAALPAAATGEGPNWQEQDGILRDMWMHNQPPAAIAKALNRSVPAVMTRAARLGLPRRFAPGRKPGRRPIDASSTARVEVARARVSAQTDAETIQAAAQISNRICLMCLTTFQSLGRHNRICPTCKNSAEYESGSRLPDLDFPVGDS
jgi:hypothetical protein